MNILLTKLDSIASETGEGTQQNKSKAAGDEFKRLKAHITSDVKEIRELLKERDVLLERPNTAGTKATVQLSHKIRMQLKGVREDANKLRELQRKEVSKAKGKAAAIQQAEQRQDLVELVFKHVEDCENLVRILLLVPTGGTELPDLETAEGLKQLQRKDQQIDEALEQVMWILSYGLELGHVRANTMWCTSQVAEGVSELKNIALDMRDEVKMQSSMVDEITSKVRLWEMGQGLQLIKDEYFLIMGDADLTQVHRKLRAPPMSLFAWNVAYLRVVTPDIAPDELSLLVAV
ncbi:MAG: hypothetical protein SGPRY_000713 [Prymnesium sp.]